MVTRNRPVKEYSCKLPKLSRWQLGRGRAAPGAAEARLGPDGRRLRRGAVAGLARGGPRRAEAELARVAHDGSGPLPDLAFQLPGVDVLERARTDADLQPREAPAVPPLIGRLLPAASAAALGPLHHGDVPAAVVSSLYFLDGLLRVVPRRRRRRLLAY